MREGVEGWKNVRVLLSWGRSSVPSLGPTGPDSGKATEAADTQRVAVPQATAWKEGHTPEPLPWAVGPQRQGFMESCLSLFPSAWAALVIIFPASLAPTRVQKPGEQEVVV
jgi:hypothetical protein